MPIVNITSSSVKAPIDVLGLSNGARSGLTGFVAGVARKVAATGVTINNLLPGSFDTDRIAVTLEAQAKGLKGDDLMRMLPTLDVQDPTIQKILPNYQDTVAQEALLLNSGLGENHPKVKSNRAARVVYTRQLEQQVGIIREGILRNLKTAETTRDELKKHLEQINSKQLQNN